MGPGADGGGGGVGGSRDSGSESGTKTNKAFSIFPSAKTTKGIVAGAITGK